MDCEARFTVTVFILICLHEFGREFNLALEVIWGMSAEDRLKASDLLELLLRPDPDTRLASFDEMREHVFFSELPQHNAPLTGKISIQQTRRGSFQSWTEKDNLPLHVLAALGEIRRFEKVLQSSSSLDLNSYRGMFDMSLLHIAVETGQERLVRRLLKLASADRFDINQKDDCGWPVIQLGLHLVEFHMHHHRSEAVDQLTRIIEMIARHDKSDLHLTGPHGRNAYILGKSSPHPQLSLLFQDLEFENEVVNNLKIDAPFPLDAFRAMWSESNEDRHITLHTAFWGAVKRTMAAPMTKTQIQYVKQFLLPLPVFDSPEEFKQFQDFVWSQRASLHAQMHSARNRLILGTNTPTRIDSPEYLLSFACSQFSSTLSFVRLTTTCRTLAWLRISSAEKQAVVAAKLVTGAMLARATVPGKVKQCVPPMMVKELKDQAVLPEEDCLDQQFLDSVEEQVFVPLLVCQGSQARDTFKARLTDVLEGDFVEAYYPPDEAGDHADDEQIRGKRVLYMAPVKGAKRMAVKVIENRNESTDAESTWPHTQQLGDCLRCTVDCPDAQQMLRTWQRICHVFRLKPGRGRLKNKLLQSKHPPDMLVIYACFVFLAMLYESCFGSHFHAMCPDQCSIHITWGWRDDS